MALPWLLALKVIPWGDVIEHAPKVLNAARKLMDRQKSPESTPTAAAPMDLVSDTPPSLGELRNRLIEARQLIDQQAQTQTQVAQTLAELAEQNARLVAAVELLRVRTRVLMFVIAALAVGMIVLFVR
jgi:small-conductance mechanosensitive channel